MPSGIISGFQEYDYCRNYLDEVCNNGGCETFMFAIGDCACFGETMAASGCDGQICLIATGNPLDCLCEETSFNFFGITVSPYSSGAAGGGYHNLNCEGKAGYDVTTCGTYLWEHIVPNDPIFTYCYESTSGLFEYQIEFDSNDEPIPATCNRYVPIFINTKNHWCDIAWTEDIGLYATYDVNVEDDNTGFHLNIDYNGEQCPHAGNLFDSSAVSKDFCTSCDRCEWRAVITVCNGQTGSELDLDLPGTHNGSAPITYLATIPGPGPTCALACKTTIVSGILLRGKHHIDFTFGRSLSSYIPVGTRLEVDFKFTRCWNECKVCKCGYLEPDTLYYDWTDTCFGYALSRQGDLQYDDEYCFWESDCFWDSGVNRTTKFYLVCREHCCSLPTGFPFKPADLSADPHYMYLYEFYNNGTGCPDFDSPNYYVWKKTNECNPLNFERAWEGCVGAVSEESLGCEHSFKIYSECISGNMCDTCNINIYVYGEENHLAAPGYYRIHKDDYVIQDGEIGEEGFIAVELPSGDQPWYFEYVSGYCYGAVSGEINCDDSPFTFYAPTSDNCVVHSGNCTLCGGFPIPKTLYLSDNFGETVLNWGGSSWSGANCVYLESCWTQPDSLCINGSGWQSVFYELSCERSGFRMDAVLPYRSCDCGTGCPCAQTPLPYYSDSSCSTPITMSGCDPSSISLYFSQYSGNFNWDCYPFDLSVYGDVQMYTGCGYDNSLYGYEGSILS